MQSIWSPTSGKFRQKTDFKQVTANNIMKVLVYRVVVNESALFSERGSEEAFERTGSKEVATMKALGLLRYITPLVTILILAISNEVLSWRIRKLSVKAIAPFVYEDSLDYRLLSTTLAKIQPQIPTQNRELNNDERILAFDNIRPVIGLRPQGGVGFVYKMRGSQDQKKRCGCEMSRLF